MKIGILTWGSNGDVRPFIALAAGLSARGHDVQLDIASIEGRDYSGFAGLERVTVQQANVPEPEVSQLELERLIIAQRNPLQQLHYIMEYMFNPLQEQMLEFARELCRDCDLVIGHVLVYQLDIAARQSGTPRVSVTLSPLLPSGHIPLLGHISLGVTGNRLLWKLGQLGTNRILIPQVNAMRRREGLPPAEDFFYHVGLSPDLNLLAASPTLVPQPPDWPPHCRVSGALTMPEHNEPWDMPTDLKAFLNAGAAPVFIGFGSMMDVSVRHWDTTATIIDAVLRAGCRAIVQSRWDELTDLPQHPDIYRLRTAPHRQIFPHCALVVHHGGAGTTSSALLCGRPQVIIAHGMDQEFWQGRLRALGVSAGGLHRRRLNARRLAKLIRRGLDAPGLQQRAQAVAEQVRGEDGIAEAVAHIEAVGKDGD